VVALTLSVVYVTLSVQYAIGQTYTLGVGLEPVFIALSPAEPQAHAMSSFDYSVVDSATAARILVSLEGERPAWLAYLKLHTAARMGCGFPLFTTEQSALLLSTDPAELITAIPAGTCSSIGIDLVYSAAMEASTMWTTPAGTLAQMTVLYRMVSG